MFHQTKSKPNIGGFRSQCVIPAKKDSSGMVLFEFELQSGWPEGLHLTEPATGT